MNTNILKPENIGKKVTCNISGRPPVKGKLQFWNDSYYICQNVINGSTCADTLGYRYSWRVDRYVTDLKLVHRSPDDLESIVKGDTIVNDSYTRKVLEVLGSIYIVSSSLHHDKFGNVFTIADLNMHNYRIDLPKDEVEEVVEELTMEEVCKALGKTIKIKK